MTHGCIISGLTALGIDAGGSEFAGDNGSDAVSPLERYQVDTGLWLYQPWDKYGSWNKDTIIAVGDLYNGSNVYQRYYLTEDKYKDLVHRAEELLENEAAGQEARKALETAYQAAAAFVSEDGGSSFTVHGQEYYALQEAVFAVDVDGKPNVFLGTSQEREQVAEVKDAISSISSYSYADKERLDTIKAQYDALKEERLFHYVDNKNVLDAAMRI